MKTGSRDLRSLQNKVWEGSVPLEIRLASAECTTYGVSDAFLIHVPRISYIPLLLPKLHAFFRSSLINHEANFWDGWLSYEDVPLKWHFPLGLLYDLYSGASELLQDDNGLGGKKGQPVYGAEEQKLRDQLRTWKLTLHYENWPSESLAKLDQDGKFMRDAFTNSVKEASFLRHGSGKVVMALSKEDSTQLWDSVEQNDFTRFYPVSQRLFHPPGANLRHIPTKIYLPATASEDDKEGTSLGHLKVVQSLITPSLSARQPQTVGTALNALLPSLFPSRRSPLLALPMLHGAVVPLNTNLQSLAEAAGYADGFLHVAVVMMV
ncbi:autophagy protein 5 [Tothia fuscella]|uniref:Autophagy protein 5 n=1 Tax=Tothia fuscella TaxID=1048955 RepID=A0A9P4P1B7_9PEZI|nr:autophagy protein 5 [Tothia fuscella]